MFKDGIGLFQEIQGLLKVFYFPILFLSLYVLRNEIRISNMTLFTTLLIYIILIFIPQLIGIGFKTYDIAKVGTLGFFNAANEIGGIIALLTPILFTIIVDSKKWISRIIIIILYLSVILMMGTKTPLISLCITLGFSLGYFWAQSVKKKKYKNIILSFLIAIVGIAGLLIIIPKTNFYKNIEIHRKFLRIESISDVFKNGEMIDHFIFSQRLSFLHDKALWYKESNLYQKIFGIGYVRNGKTFKMVEMDYFDIYYSHGVIGLLLFLLLTLYIVYKILEKEQKLTYERFMKHTCLVLMVLLSFFTGHIITAPSVSFICIILMLSLANRKKKDLLFTSHSLRVGGIENAQVNLLNRINFNHYNVTLVLEEQKGELLKRVSKKVNIKEVKVSNFKIVWIRKIINGTRKLIFNILNNQIYDFSCCYATYSYSGNVLAKMASKNNAFYVHSDYQYIYTEEKDYRQFFDSRKISDYTRIIFVSNESEQSFLKYYKDFKGKTIVINNFINSTNILEKSKEPIRQKREKNKTLFVFVGRLDDTSKKVRRAITLANNIEEIELWIIGNGPDKKAYEDFAKENNRVKFLGEKANPYSYMREADYIILTSDYEGFPVTYLEALVLGKNIITTIRTSDDEIDMKDYAFIVSKEPQEMEKQVRKILKEKQNQKKLNIEKIQKYRERKLEKVFSGE